MFAIVKREQGTSPALGGGHVQFASRWVARDIHGNFLDVDRFRSDLKERLEPQYEVKLYDTHQFVRSASKFMSDNVNGNLVIMGRSCGRDGNSLEYATEDGILYALDSKEVEVLQRYQFKPRFKNFG